VGDSFRQIKKQNAEDNVNGEKLDAFDPVGFAVAADLKQDINRSDHREETFVGIIVVAIYGCLESLSGQ
jgi:hypothetical protein